MLRNQRTFSSQLKLKLAPLIEESHLSPNFVSDQDQKVVLWYDLLENVSKVST